MIKTMNSMLMPKIPKLPVPLHVNDWLDYLGDKEQVLMISSSSPFN